MRFKVDWNNVLPASTDEKFVENAGCYADVRLHVKGTSTAISAEATNCAVQTAAGEAFSPATIATGSDYTFKVSLNTEMKFVSVKARYGYGLNGEQYKFLDDMPYWSEQTIQPNDDGTYTLTEDITKYGEVEIVAVASDDVINYTVKHILTTSLGKKVVVSTDARTGLVGDEITADASLIPADYAAFSGTTTLTVEEGKMEYVFNIVESGLPFTTSESFKNANWQTVYIRPFNKAAGSGYWMYEEAKFKTTAQEFSGDFEEKHLWAFVGNVIQGFKIYNKAAGNELTVRKTHGHNTQATLTADASDVYNTFFVAKGKGTNKEGTVAFGVADDLMNGSDKVYLNCRGDNTIKGWTYDEGCGCIFAAAHVVKLNAVNTLSDGNSAVATFSADHNFVMPSTVKAYYSTEEGENNSIVLTEASGVLPANEGFFLTGSAAGNVCIVASSETATTLEGTNLFKATDGSEIGSGVNAYILQGKDGAPMFYKLSSTDRVVAKNKAYLELPTDVAAVKLMFDGNVTAIDNVELTINKGVFYDLSGRKVVAPAKGGIYIQNGKKIIF